MDEKLSIPARFDSASVEAFADALRQRRNQPVDLDGGEVKMAGALALQALVATRRQWQADAVPFSLINPSKALLDACRMLGVPPGEIGAASEEEGAA